MADETDPFPERHLRAKLRVTVTDGRGRPKAAGRLSTWLARTAPTAAVGLASVALVGLKLTTTTVSPAAMLVAEGNT